MDTIHNDIHPAHIPLVEFGLSGQSLIVGEQHLDIIDSMLEEAFLQATISLAIRQNLINFSMAQSVFFVVILKNVVLHVIVLLVFASVFFQSKSNDSIHRFLLLFGHGVNNILKSLISHFIFSFIIVFELFFRLRFFLVSKHWRISALYVSVTVFIIAHNITVLDNVCNVSTRISRRQYKRNFSNNTVHNISADLLELVGVYGQRRNITVPHEFLGVPSHFGIVEISVSVHAFGSILQLGMA